ncbi:MAG TPA: ATP-binding protein [Prolixibacteraceae bacterium]|nr:ATP-binding protein [Prolixibacteraceae bacterium]
MKIKDPIKLTVPNKAEYLPIIDKTVSATARLLGFGKMDIAKIELGLEEAVVNILNNSFAPGEESTYDVILQPQTTGMKIILKEMGIPFDPGQMDEYDPGRIKETLSEKGLGIFLMQQFVDEVSFINLGKSGKETHLFKHFSNRSVEKIMTAEEREQAREAILEEPLPRNSVEFTVREILEKEAIEISKCAYSSYGYTYINEDIYFPDRIWKLNQSGELISLVPVTSEGKIMGHTALEIEERDPLFPQLGMAFVMPRYQGQGCMNRVVPLLIQKGKERGFAGIYARGITAHPYSQKSLSKFGMKDTALLVSSGPGREYKGIIEGKTQRESVVLLSLFLKEIVQRKLYLPPRHQNLIEKIYAHLEIPLKNLRPKKTKPVEKTQSSVSVSIENVNQVAHIVVKEYGNNIIDEIARNLRSLCIDRIETIYLHLKMTDPLLLLYIDSMESLLFFFAGIMPASDGNDELILQYLNNYRIDYNKVMVATEMAQEIKEYIRKLDPNQQF